MASFDFNKVLIFDWDDTICPSSFVDRCKVESYKDLPIENQHLIDILGKCAAECLEAASQYGQVIIITNSDDGWVKFSAERYIPNLLHILPKYRIVSARTRYEKFYPGQPLCWKAAAFAHEVNESFSSADERLNARLSSNDSEDDGVNTSCESLVSTDDSSNGSYCEENEKQSMKRISRAREVISFGDSMEERTAVKIVAAQLSCIPKSVKFVTCPTPSDLIGQLKMLTDYMKYVCENKSPLDLEISPRRAHKCGESYIQQNMPIQEEKRNIDTISSRIPRFA
mmetsp:Transcript_22410/g.21544  ORF Transcript_22410/g.21544 Transcript_22410/m.21544 type:complete len:283 (-) Transcript_22410:246-1094(-)|eukprot:CAMPEP_0197826446 /NCGR_PEP_ID=MMETSP1437-20131217/3410_1 /TAXON_ID=49252 ORGANISM="Eucampia antarctica, Strain CCMP1452" /NCGR_SAMPLE_ID=MMETSP1437 /ASSEMBLY_ACC=CAM_ASM_001096 /LENGTH=282 /DNA_ID=CAMNT_0043426895 /DNA_START=72 /DNA_END=920 /DNA_ORIENTATION=+